MKISFQDFQPVPHTPQREAFAQSSYYQPCYADVHNLPFDPKRVYQWKVQEKKYVDRKWITIKVIDHQVMGIYCNVCLAFTNSSSAFTDGFTQYSHIHERISDHKASKSHNSSVMALIDAQSSKDISSLVNVETANDRQHDIYSKQYTCLRKNCICNKIPC